MASVREPLFESVNVRIVRIAHPSAATVVTFGNYADGSGLPAEGFGEAFLNGRGIDAIHVVASGNDWYHYPEMADALAVIRTAVGEGRQSFTYGSSMGGYAALRFAGALGAEAAIAISPQYAIDRATVPFERRWRAEAKRLRILPWPARAPEPPAILFFDPHNPDAHHAAMWARERAVIEVALPHAGHPATTFLVQTGLLAQTLVEIFEGRFDADHLMREARGRRRASAHYHAMLARAQPPRRQRAMLRLATHACTLAPGSAAYLGQSAVLHHRAGEDGEAERLHRLALATAPGDPLALFRLSRFLQRRRRYGEALALARAAVTRDPGSAALVRHAVALALALGPPLSPARGWARSRNFVANLVNRIGWRRGWRQLDRLERP